ncbi:MAG: hypothetical protein AAF548_13685 [Actinomycetota bacterium]
MKGEPVEEWDVGIVWLSRRLHRPDRMLSRRWRAARRVTAQEEAERATTRDYLEAGDGCASALDLGWVGAIVLIVVFLGVLSALGPGLLAITVGLIEIIVVLLGAVIVGAGRVLFGVPWEIVARRGDDELTWRIKGYRPARALIEEVESGLRQGLDPATLARSDRDLDPPDLRSVPGLYHRREFRWIGRIFGPALLLAAILLLAVLIS